MGLNICTINPHIKLSTRALKLQGAGTGNAGSVDNYPKADDNMNKLIKLKKNKLHEIY
jgi:hypothetical protein